MDVGDKLVISHDVKQEQLEDVSGDVDTSEFEGLRVKSKEAFPSLGDVDSITVEDAEGKTGEGTFKVDSEALIE